MSAHGAPDGPDEGRGSVWDRWVRTAAPPPVAEVRGTLWSGAPPAAWDDLPPATRDAVLAQYDAYVEGADRVSARRATANSFFLTLNTAVVTAVGVLGAEVRPDVPATLVVPWVALLAQCLAWFSVLRAYRQLNAAKYVVIGAIEEVLPLSPWWRAEWRALGAGRDPARYRPVGHVEALVPALFALAYTAGLVLALVVPPGAS
ncbi:RipA family octameric membrane protein [Cellulomonas endophytica]|uniref:RipA family octameric membrane protein n=1 Tax=Cellulomonas endophytica TaxID=2494735 RepID=UPI00196AF86C|nr:hypothetical protein [Cellulomonas endophytica]